MEHKYQIGKKLFVIKIGVCEVASIENKIFQGEPRAYYILHPIFKNCSDTIILPVDSNKNIKELVNEEEAKLLLKDFKKYENYWIKNPRERKDAFMNILNSGELITLKNLYLTLQNKKIELFKNKKLLNTTDKYVLDSCINILSEIVAVVLSLNYEEMHQKFENYLFED